MLRWLLKTINLGRLSVALVLAVVVWGYVIATQYPEETPPPFNDMQVTLVNKPNSDSLYLRQVSNETVKVTISGAKDKVTLVTRSAIQPFIDLKTCTKPGTCELKVQLKQPLDNVSSYTIEPNAIQVQLEEVISKQLEVQVNKIGSVKLGYQQGDIELNTSVVSVTGPKSVVDLVDKAQITVNLNDRESGLQGPVDVVLLDDKGQAVDNTNKALILSPKTIDVNVPVNFKLNSKTVPVQVLTVGSPAPGYIAGSSITVFPSLVTLTGDPSVLEPIKFVETRPVDLNNTNTDIQTTVDLVPPFNTTTGGVTKAQVRIGITEAQASVPVVGIPVTVVNPPSLRYQVTPNVITITLEGPYQLLQPKLPLDQIKATIDLAGRNEPGTFEVPLQVQTPAKLVATNLPKITVTIVAPPRPTATPIPLPQPTVTTAPPTATSTAQPTPDTPANPPPVTSPGSTPPGATGVPTNKPPSENPTPTNPPPTTKSANPTPAAGLTPRQSLPEISETV